MTDSDIREYLESLGLGEPLLERGVAVARRFSELVNESVQYVFADDYRDEDGSRHFGDLWVFFPRYACEQYEWTSAAVDKGDVAGIEPGLTRVMFDARDFEFANATDASRLSLDVQWSAQVVGSLQGSLRASGKNCETLATIFRAYFVRAI